MISIRRISPLATSHSPLRARPQRLLGIAASILALAALAACAKRADMRPLGKAGMDSPSIAELRKLDTTDAEVAELVKLKTAGFGNSICIDLVRIARGHNHPFNIGDDLATLQRIGLPDLTILELARLDQFGPWTDEIRAMHLAGVTDATILALAERHAAGKPVLSSFSLAKLKNAGFNDLTVLELARRGLTDSDADEILRLPAAQRSTAELLRRYPPK